MGINIYEHKVQIIWKRTICVGSGVTFIGTPLEEVCMPLMFSESMATGQIELFVEYFTITQQNSYHVISYDAGTSRRAQEPSFAGTSEHATQEFDVGGIRLGDNENIYVNDDIISPEKADFLDPQSPHDSEDVEIDSTDSDEDPSDDGEFVHSRPFIPRGEEQFHSSRSVE